MPVLKEWKCKAHGFFESFEKRCPKGCTTVEQAFLTPVGTRSDRTKSADANLRQIALDFGLSNMASAREGEPTRIKTKQQRDAEALEVKLRHRFAPMAKGGTFNAETKKITGGNVTGGALAAMAAQGAQPTPQMQAAREAFISPVHSVAQFPKTTIIKRDPDRDSIAKVKAA